MFFGGSALLHLLAGHPRLVAFFGLAAAITTIVYAPFGAQAVPGTAQYVQTLDRTLSADGVVDAAALANARASAGALRASSPAELKAVIDKTLEECGQACTGVDTASVLENAVLLDDVLLIHELNRVRQDAVQTQPTSRQTPR